MKNLILNLLLITLAAFVQTNSNAQRLQQDPEGLLRPDIFRVHGRHIPGHYKLCTYDDDAYNKCLHLVHVAQNSSIDVPLECVQKEDRNTCIRSVAAGATDMLVLTGHGYQEARKAGLYPVIFERDSNDSLYIAVAPSNITLVEIQTAPIEVDQSNHREFHAAAYFNLRRDHDICLYLRAALESTSIKIVDSAEYVPNDDEILLCPDRSYAQASAAAYQRCNFEAGLQRAIFIPRRSSRSLAYEIKRIVSTILERFGPEPEHILNDNNFNFFSTFNGKDNVIFKNNAVDFDFHPTYINGVSEAAFNLLHCNTDGQVHDPSELE